MDTYSFEFHQVVYFSITSLLASWYCILGEYEFVHLSKNSSALESIFEVYRTQVSGNQPPNPWYV